MRVRRTFMIYGLIHQWNELKIVHADKRFLSDRRILSGISNVEHSTQTRIEFINEKISSDLPLYRSRPLSVILVRGGGGSSHGHEYDYDDIEDYDEYDDFEAENRYHSRRHTSTSARNQRGTKHPHKKQTKHKRNGQDANSAAAAVNLAFNVAKKTADVATATAVSSIKGSTRAALHLASPKFVARKEIMGVWRFDQQVGSIPNGPFTSCAANIEFTPKGETITIYNEKEMISTFFFSERNWPRSCTIEFEANAFQGPMDKEPVKMLYRGHFRRKLAKRSVIKIEGKMYSVSGGNRLWSRRREELVGSFTARKRIDAKQMYEEEEGTGDEEYDDFDEYDEYDDEYDEENDYDEFQ